MGVLLVNDSINAVDVLEKLTPLLSGTEYAGLLDGVARAIDDYDFDRALEVLMVLIGELGIEV